MFWGMRLIILTVEEYIVDKKSEGYLWRLLAPPSCVLVSVTEKAGIWYIGGVFHWFVDFALIY